MATILLVEDDRAIRKTLATFIAAIGHNSILCANGKQAIDALSADNPIDVIVTDMMMPEMDGRQFIQIIRKDDTYKNIPIIIISAYMGIKDIADLLKLGATLFLAKPIKLPELEENIQRCLTTDQET